MKNITNSTLESPIEEQVQESSIEEQVQESSIEDQAQESSIEEQVQESSIEEQVQESKVYLSYNLVLDHSASADVSHILQLVESSSKLIVHNALHQSDSVITGLLGEGVVTVNEIKSSIANSLPSAQTDEELTCDQFHIGDTCTLAKVTVSIDYPETITKDDVRFQFLQYSQEIAETSSNALLEAKYVGPIPIKTRTTFTLSGIELLSMEQHHSKYFSNAVNVFLNNIFAGNSVHIDGVRVDKQELQEMKHGRLRSHDAPNRFLQDIQDTPSISALGITTTIIGEFTPPPNVDLGDLIDVAFEESGMFFVESLQENELFAQAINIHSSSITQRYMHPAARVEVDMRENSIFYVKEFAIPLYVILGFLAMFGIVYLAKEVTKKKTTVKVLGMEELMEKRDSIVDTCRDSRTVMTTKSSTKTIDRNSLKSFQLRSEQRVFSANRQK